MSPQYPSFRGRLLPILSILLLSTVLLSSSFHAADAADEAVDPDDVAGCHPGDGVWARCVPYTAGEVRAMFQPGPELGGVKALGEDEGDVGDLTRNADHSRKLAEVDPADAAVDESVSALKAVEEGGAISSSDDIVVSDDVADQDLKPADVTGDDVALVADEAAYNEFAAYNEAQQGNEPNQEQEAEEEEEGQELGNKEQPEEGQQQGLLRMAGDGAAGAADGEGSSGASKRRVLRDLGYGYWFAVDNQLLDEEGRVIKFSGVTWNGFDSQSCVVDGIAGGSGLTYSDHLDKIQGAGFNVVRLPFSTDCLMYDDRMPAREAIDADLSPELKNMTVIQVIDAIVKACRDRGLRVILANTRIGPALPPDFEDDLGVWWDAGHPENVWIGNWMKLAQRYIGERAVVGFDLYNEIHNHPSHPDIIWAGDNVGEPYNWRTAVKRAADAIQSINPDLLIIVQGLGTQYTWRGADQRGVMAHPLKLKVKYKLAYAINDFGPFVDAKKPWFRDANFPENLEAYWDAAFGFIPQKNFTPLIVTQWGSRFPSVENTSADFQEMQYLEKFQRYIRSRSAGWVWLTWGPTNKEVGGLLAKSWKKMEQPKLSFLQPIMHPGFGPANGEQPWTAPGHGKLVVFAPDTNVTVIGSGEDLSPKLQRPQWNAAAASPHGPVAFTLMYCLVLAFIVSLSAF
ncbi:hypothetical protein CLOM_g13644 [Closterium sp. NIES-68]|nr:hypothetical protein CLOM_g13644 [Closterium sp. NIES-68]